MQSASYVVHLIGCDDDPPFKHFGARADAVEHGRSEVQSGNAELANIYEVAGKDGVAAIALWQAGNATHIQTCLGRHRTRKSRLPISGHEILRKRQARMRYSNI
jgi:hypothetical protein